MKKIWHEHNKFTIWRQLWLALAEAQKQLGIQISKSQIAQLRSKVNSFKEDPEEQLRLKGKDVKSHLELLMDSCPEAKDIINLGASESDITENADLILIRESLIFIANQLVDIIHLMAKNAMSYASLPCVSQPLTTFGKRICLWINDLFGDLRSVEEYVDKLGFHGFKGTCGTQFSYLKLLGDRYKILLMERIISEKMGFKKCYSITGQTYPRKIDAFISAILSGIGQSAYKFGLDLKFMKHEVICDTDKLCTVAKQLVNECHNAENVMMDQILEGGSERDLSKVFLLTESVLENYMYVVKNSKINRTAINQNACKILPVLMKEKVLDKALKSGLDKQYIVDELKKDLSKDHPHLGKFIDQNDFDSLKYIGCAAEQVKVFVRDTVNPLRAKYFKK